MEAQELMSSKYTVEFRLHQRINLQDKTPLSLRKREHATVLLCTCFWLHNISSKCSMLAPSFITCSAPESKIPRPCAVPHSSPAADQDAQASLRGYFFSSKSSSDYMRIVQRWICSVGGCGARLGLGCQPSMVVNTEFVWSQSRL